MTKRGNFGCLIGFENYECMGDRLNDLLFVGRDLISEKVVDFGRVLKGKQKQRIFIIFI